MITITEAIVALAIIILVGLFILPTKKDEKQKNNTHK